MIVNKPIGSIKVGNSICRLTIGKEVPAVVLEYWKSTGQIEDLKKSGAISESKVEAKNFLVGQPEEIKTGYKSDSIFKNEK